MQKINFCKQCLNPSTRPNTYFDKNGFAMFVFMKKIKKNLKTNKYLWEKKEKEIKRICKWARNNSKSSYDCIIPVSGGKDSYRQSFYARDNRIKSTFGIQQLPPEQWTDIGAYNLQNLVNHGFDIINISLDPVFGKNYISIVLRFMVI